MISLGIKHFPQIRYKGDVKTLWNPILKRNYTERPEERVRLKFIEYLMFEAGFSKNRISFESPVSLLGDKSSSRSDIICYNDDFKPLLLVECKAPKVQLDEKTALQIARYNTEINAPYLMVTNGLRDFCFVMKSGQITHLEELPSFLLSKNTIDSNFEYWQDRGFVGTLDKPVVQNWLIENCNQLFTETLNPTYYIDFKGIEPDLQLANFYQILVIDEQTRLAISMTSTPDGATKLNAILNQDGQNVGLFSASLNIIASDQPDNTVIKNANGIKVVNVVEKIEFNFLKSVMDLAPSISELIKR